MRPTKRVVGAYTIDKSFIFNWNRPNLWLDRSSIHSIIIEHELDFDDIIRVKEIA